MNSTLELELVVFEESVEDVEYLHLICLPCHLETPNVCLCGTFEPGDVENKEYLNCVVCFDYFEVGVCPKGHVLKAK